MASVIPSQVARRFALRQLRAPAFRPSIGACTCLRCARFYSSETPQTPPLMSKIKGDLKAAMKARDAARLTVLRSVISQFNNASKTSKPIQTDVQLVALLRTLERGSQEAADDARKANRPDLVEQEEAQIKILGAYAAESGVQSVGEEELKGIVRAVIGEVASEGITDKWQQKKEVFTRLMRKGGPLDGKDVNRGDVAKLADKLLA